MRLGWIDRVEGQTVHMLPKVQNSDLFEPKISYAQKFFSEIMGLGNIEIVTVRGHRVISRAKRGMGGN